jgi:hypothetical protein
MTGGLLQVVARGTEDIYLSGDPNITFFKTVYRRHTNFSRSEIDLNFTNRLDFGKEGYCRIDHYGDLVHRLFLVINLPKIQLKYRSLTIGEVQKLLATYDIIWDIGNRDPTSKFTEIDYIEVEKLIDEKIVSINEEINTINYFLGRFNGPFNYVTWKASHPFYNDTIITSNGSTEASGKYLDDVIEDFFSEDFFDVEFQIINAHYKDIVNYDGNIFPTPLQRPLANSVAIQKIMLSEFITYAVNNELYPPTITSGYNDDNLEFLYNVDTANYSISGSVTTLDANTVFRSAISNVYSPSTSYTALDAYKIFDVILNNNNATITSSSDIQNIKDLLINNIRYGLIKNIKLLTNIYNSLNTDSRFIFYRKFPVTSVGSGVYNTNSLFTNASLVSNLPASLNDNFTSDFYLTAEPNEPINVTHPMSNAVNTIVNNFHTTNRNLFRDSKLSAYFDQISSLWSKTDVASNPLTPVPVPANMYYMNYLWFNMTNNIPNAINDYLFVNTLGLLPATRSNLYSYLNTVIRPNILLVITPLITYQGPSPTNYDSIISLDTIKTINGVNGDIILCAIIRPGIENSLIFYGLSYLTIPEYISARYNDAINSYAPADPNYNSAKPILLDIVKLFMTDYDSIPSYSSYINQNSNIYSDPTKRINNIKIPLTVYSDVECSIWNYLYLQFVKNYNNLFNQSLLGYSYYTNNIGAELFRYLDYISTTWLPSFIPPPILYDYFTNVPLYKMRLPVNSGIGSFIGQYLNLRLLEFNDYLSFYDNNRRLLDMRNIIVPRSRYYYDEFNTIVNYISNIIETNLPLYSHLYHSPILSPDKDIVRITKATLNDKTPEYIVQRNNAIDITLIMETVAYNFFNDAGIPSMVMVNPYNPLTDPYKNQLWDKYVGKFKTSIEKKKFNDPNPIDPSKTLFDWLYRDTGEPISDGAQELYNYVLQIDVLYNGFVVESDVYKFMRDYVIQKSILKDLPGLIGVYVRDTYNNLVAYYEAKRIYNENLKSRIVGNDDIIGIKTILERSLNTNANAKFAWIKKIGHYLIDQIYIKIDDQLIDKHYGEWLEIWHSLSKRTKKENGYNSLIGNINELYTFNNFIKNEYQLIIPLQFWFCRAIGSSIPLVALHNADVRLYVKLRKFDEVSYYEQFTTFRNKPRLKCNVIAEYIYVEEEERNKIATSKLEYLVDVLQYNGDITITNGVFDDQGYIQAITKFKNSSKAIYWLLQNNSYINGSLDNGEKRWDLYSYDLAGTTNPGKIAKIQFNGRDREIFKEIEFYNFVHAYERHNSDPTIGINAYCFSLNPESLQPEGSANLSRIDDVYIVMNLKDEVMEDISVNNTTYRMGIYSLSINVLRIFSGLGGLVFE